MTNDAEQEAAWEHVLDAWVGMRSEWCSVEECGRHSHLPIMISHPAVMISHLLVVISHQAVIRSSRLNVEVEVAVPGHLLRIVRFVKTHHATLAHRALPWGPRYSLWQDEIP